MTEYEIFRNSFKALAIIIIISDNMTNGQSQKTPPVNPALKAKPVTVLTEADYVPIFIEGATPGDRVTAKVVLKDGTIRTVSGLVADNGGAGLNVGKIETPGEYQVIVSVASTGQTTQTTATVRTSGSGPKPK